MGTLSLRTEYLSGALATKRENQAFVTHIGSRDQGVFFRDMCLGIYNSFVCDASKRRQESS